MPNAFQRKTRYAMVSANVAGPADYRPAPGNLRPTIQMPCKDIDTDMRDIEMEAAGYIIRPMSVAGNVITFMVMTENRNAQAGATANHAAHTHDLLIIKNAGAADQVNIAGGAIFESDAVTATVVGGAVTGGVQVNAAVQAHAGVGAALQDIPFGEEVLIGSNLAAVNIMARVYARVR